MAALPDLRAENIKALSTFPLQRLRMSKMPQPYLSEFSAARREVGQAHKGSGTHPPPDNSVTERQLGITRRQGDVHTIRSDGKVLRSGIWTLDQALASTLLVP